MSTYYKWSFGLVFHFKWSVKDLGSLSCHSAGISPHFLSLSAVQLLPHNWPLHLLSSLSRCTLQAYWLLKSQFKHLLLCEAFSKSSRDLRVLLLCSYGALSLSTICPRTQSSDDFSLATPSSRLSHKVPPTFLLNLYFLPWLLWVPGLYIKYLHLDV